MNNFERESRFIIDDGGIQYDYNSLMHYRSQAFSKNGKITIAAIGDRDKQLGRLDGMSVKDVIRLNKLYKCEGKFLTNLIYHLIYSQLCE